MSLSAVFLDRDGTIIEDAGYLGDPEKVRLFPDAAEAIRRLNQSGCSVVLVSNQSGVARGLFTDKEPARVHARVESLLAAKGARLDGAYYCPYLDGPDAKVAAFRRDSELRKPKPGMLLQAAKERELDLTRSWMIGDSPADVEAGSRAGCRTILLERNGAAPAADVTPTFRVATLLEAAAIVEREMNQDPIPATPSPFKGEGRGEGQAPPRYDGHANPRAADASPDDRMIQALERIHGQLERAQRKDRQHDFSSLRLLAALLQMLAVVTTLWGVVALLDDQAAATGRIALACFFQLASLTAFLTDRLR